MLFLKKNKRNDLRSDEELLKQFTETGDIEVLGELYYSCIHLVYGVCIKYLRNREDSQDAVMQIFEKLITEVPRHKIDNFKNWLHAVTKNYCLMQIRSEKSKTERIKEWVNDQANFMENNQVLHPIDEDGKKWEESMADCIERLKHEQKECIRLFYYENKCYNEIASRMGLHEKKVKSHLQNAKRNLKLCLEEKDVRQK